MEHARRTGSAGPVVLATKLHAPAVRSALVARPGLLDRLEPGSLPGLTVLAAPPGWGKTTLLTGLHARDDAVAWLALDRADNDHVRFWTYVVESLRTVVPGVGDRALSLLRVPEAGLLDAVLPTLVNDLAGAGEPLVLVLDDYHVVTSTVIHTALEFLLEHRPPRLRIVLATRSDPPLPLARLRARGDLLELRADELRFSLEEAQAFLNDVLGLELAAGDVELLHRRTEGWAAGLYLAALSLRGRDDVHAFVADFAGDDRLLLDYLVSEVLERLPAELRTFLLRTSILDRLTGALCDAVVGEEGSARRLAEIERSNLFLVPLDPRRAWYRYHHLFAELLRHELHASEPDVVPALHARAAAWLRRHGAVGDAIRHAHAAGDPATAGDLVALHWNEYLNQGRLETVARWLDGLPAEVVAGDARLCLARAGTSLTLGRRDEVDRWLDAARRAPLPPGAVLRTASIESEEAVYRAVHGFMLGDLSGARAAAARAVELERAESSPWRAMALAALGRTLFWQGEADAAAARLEEAVRLYQPESNNISVIGALGYLAVIAAERGDARAAEEFARRALALAAEHRFTEHWVSLMALVALGLMRERAGRLVDADAALERAAQLARRGAGPSERGFALLALARVRRALGGADAARAPIAEAREVVGRCVDPGILTPLLAQLDRSAAARPGSADDALTLRELAVLRLLSSDQSLREIGEALFVSRNTVKTHVRGIYRKLDASTRREAVARARELGLV